MTIAEMLKNASWWRMNKKEDAKEDIEWTASHGGFMRARLSKKTSWNYKVCKQAEHALSLGQSLLN